MLNSRSTPSFEDQARQLLRAAGARVTTPRTQVLSAMLRVRQDQRSTVQALSHQEVADQLDQSSGQELPDRVTLYRILEWLVEQGLAHKMAGEDRVYRFSLNDTAADPQREPGHAHFQCLHCHRMYCLHDSALVRQALKAALPKGFKAQELAASVRGVCADCQTSDLSEKRI